MVDRDSRDIFEIKRLRRQARDLEIQHEIKQIRKRIRELELQREMRKETKSRYVVRDDVNEQEEYPSFDSHPRFIEPIYQQYVLEDKPRYDEDVIILEAEECLFIHRVLSGFPLIEDHGRDETELMSGGGPTVVKDHHGLFWDYQRISPDVDGYWRGSDTCVAKETVRLSGESLVKEVSDCAKLSASIMNDHVVSSVVDDPVSKFCKSECDNDGDSTVVVGSPVADATQSSPKIWPTFMPDEAGFHIKSVLTEYPIIIGIQNIRDYVEVKKISCAGDGEVTKHGGIPAENMDIIKKDGDLIESLVSDNDVCMDFMHESLICGPSNANEKCKVQMGIVYGHTSQQSPQNKLRDGPYVDKNYWLSQSIKSNTSVVSIGLKNEISPSKAYGLPIVNETMFSAPFCPGITGPKLGEMTREVKLFRRFIMIRISGNRVDVPFDPGVFSREAKLEDKFFSKTGSMM